MDGFAKGNIDAHDPPADNADGGTSAQGEPTGGFPRIADYWPDAPHRMGPAADFSPDEAARPADGDQAYPRNPSYPPPDQEPTQVFRPPPPPRRPWLRALLGALGALVFLGGSVFALARLVAGDDQPQAGAPLAPAEQDAVPDATGVPSPPVSVEPAPSSTAPTESPSASVTALPFESGSFELTSNVVELNLTVVDLGNEAFQVSTPEDSGLRPRAEVDGDDVTLSAPSDGSKGSGRLDVRLNERISWSLKMSGGMKNATFALDDADLRRIELVGGASRIDMTLPSHKDALPIKMSGGVNTWNIKTAREVPVSVEMRRGGGEVVLNGKRVRNINRGTTLRAQVDNSDAEGLKIDAVAGVGTLTVWPAET
ncbi:hypothetical protein Ari01nite_61180 [Paractinoplanes rishiriensis]|uniref:Uncharacterized protein n=1 Tax=Paractinoplanes rishiriensis TaxID=1050105 RepID=A0A919K1P5_9ACTN|nr:hypothetical protein Ari01nite_61180 [Actinoplanes rishiriensis]